MIVLALLASLALQDVDALIKNLGSSDIETRDAATKKLLDLGKKAREAVVKATENPDTEIASRAKDILDQIDHPTLLDRLLSDYKSYGLPLPPEGAALVGFSEERTTYNAREGLYRCVGFLLRPGVLLVGTQEYEGLEFKKLTPQDAVAVEIIPEPYPSHPPLPMNSGLATAIQCKALGLDAAAEKFLEWSINHRVDNGRRAIPADEEALREPSPRLAVAVLAWSHWENQLVKPETDRGAILKRLVDLRSRHKELDCARYREYCAALEETLKKSTAKPGTLEAAIDTLTEIHDREEPMALEVFGLEAVPVLLERFGDRRLTRKVRPAIMNAGAEHLRVGDVIAVYLGELSGGKTWGGFGISKDDAVKWWEEAKGINEEKYIRDHVVPKSTSDEPVFPNEIFLRILAKKYPLALADVYKAMLERPDVVSHKIAMAVAESSLPKEEKAGLLRAACRNKNLQRSYEAMWGLKKVDEALMTELLIERLKALPKSVNGPMWTAPEAAFAHLVRESANPEVWKAHAEATKRAEPGLRMQMIQNTCTGMTEVPDREPVIAFLRLFLDDEAVPDRSDPKKWEGPYAGFTFPGLSVKNLAAMEICWLLKLEPGPSEKWTPAQWDDLHRRIRDALKK